MKAILSRALERYCETVDGVRAMFTDALTPAPNANRRRARPKVELLEGRIALSRAGAVDAPRSGTGRVGRVAPEKNTLTVNVPVDLPAGFGWFIEVRRRAAPKSKWTWKGPYGDPTKAIAKLRKQGFVTRRRKLELPELAADQQTSPPPDTAFIDYGENTGTTPPPQAILWEVRRLDRAYPWLGYQSSGSPSEMFGTVYAAYNRASYLNTFLSYGGRFHHDVFQIQR